MSNAFPAQRPANTLSVCCKIQQEEMEYVELLAAEKHQVEALKNMQHQNKSLSILDEILEDVRKAADRLEEEIEEHAFDDNKSVSDALDSVISLECIYLWLVFAPCVSLVYSWDFSDC